MDALKDIAETTRRSFAKFPSGSAPISLPPGIFDERHESDLVRGSVSVGIGATRFDLSLWQKKEQKATQKYHIFRFRYKTTGLQRKAGWPESPKPDGIPPPGPGFPDNLHPPFTYDDTFYRP